MTTTPPSAPDQRSLFDKAAGQYDSIFVEALLSIGAALGLSAIILVYNRWTSLLPLELYLGLLSLVALGTGIFYQLSLQADVAHDRTPGDQLRPDMTAGDRFRVATLALIGLAGLKTFLYGILLVLVTYSMIFRAGLEVMRENVGTVVLCSLPLFIGLAMMFGGLALGRTLERTQPSLRRLLYGYNAVLGAVLLFAILGVLNLLSYTRVPPFNKLSSTLDWSGSGLYTLQDGTRQTVTSLKEPVDVKVILRHADPIVPEVTLMLDNCRLVNPDFQWSIVSPDDQDSTLSSLLSKYPVPGMGLLILYGKPGAQVGEFIKRDELLTPPDRRNPEASQGATFQGEFALNKTLSFLEEGRNRTTIYFTQGNGELDFSNSSSAERGKGMGKLTDLLAKGNYELLHGPADKMPEKVDVVVIAGARKDFTKGELDALRKYLKPTDGKKPGKLFVMFDVVIFNDKMVRTNVEELVAEYGVAVGDNQVLCLTRPNPREVVIVPHVGGSNPVPKPFAKGERLSGFGWFNVRPIKPSQPKPGQPYSTEVLFETYPDAMAWVEDNLKANPAELAAALLQDEKKFREQISPEPLPVAIAVTESGNAGLPPGHPGTGSEKPVLIVFGNTGWCSNGQMDSTLPLGIFTSCVAWLRERPVLGTPPAPPKRPTYELNITDDQKGRVYWLPGVLILLTTISLSLGVWLVRRR